MVKIGAELPELSQNKTGYPFFGPPCMLQHYKSYSSLYVLCVTLYSYKFILKIMHLLHIFTYG